MNLEDVRKEIDVIDNEIIPLLENRFRLVATLQNKKQSLTDKVREAEILSKIKLTYIQNIYQAIFRNSKQLLKDKGFPYEKPIIPN